MNSTGMDMKMKQKQIEYEDEEKRQCITFGATKSESKSRTKSTANSNHKLNVSRDMVYHHEVCSKTYEQLSRSCSWSSCMENNNAMNADNSCNINNKGDDHEIGTTMSEHDRKQLIMDLKSMDGDCRSDGYLLDERKRVNDKNRFAKDILNGNNAPKARRMRSYDNKNQNRDRNRGSLRAKLNELRMSMDGNRNDNQRKSNNRNDEYGYLRQKLKIYEDKLRNIDPTLLE
mmetsp:Transcript_70396/g.63186  ORF Transcript_70396/g.63186 Transcript_70396/m.63186 type:complete len:230 (+) Transcript_70396:2-691(+)